MFENKIYHQVLNPIKFLVFFFILLISNIIHAADWYVSPTGDALSTSGTLAKPWSLTYAFAGAGGKINDGDKVWLRGGKYLGRFILSVSGGPAAPIIFRSYAKELATIDGSIDLNSQSHVWFWGLEIMDSAKASQPDPSSTIVLGDVGTKFINNIIHDTNIGMGVNGPYEAYGNIMFYNGMTSREHPIYWQNDFLSTGVKKIAKDNIIFNSAGFGIHCYGSGGKLNGIVLDGNVVWYSGGLLNNYKDDILVGGGQPVDVVDINNNLIYGSDRGIRVGWSNVQNTSVSLKNNYIAIKQNPFIVNAPFTKLNFTNNVIVEQSGHLVQTLAALGTYTIDNNQYYATAGTGTFLNNNSSQTLDQWKNSGFDANSSFNVKQKPTANKVFIKPNDMDPDRFDVVVFNWENATSVTVDMTGFLKPGDVYEIRKAENYFSPLKTNETYKATGAVLPMNNMTMATPIAFAAPKSTFPEFGAFIIYRTQAGSGGAAVLGDVSGEGTVSVYDAALVAQKVVGLITFNASQDAVADVSGDGSVTIYDASLIAQFAIGLITAFPAQK